MGKINGLYKAGFPVGTMVTIQSRDNLMKFIKERKFHNPLKQEQLNYSGKTTTVLEVGYYSGAMNFINLKIFLEFGTKII